MRIFKLFFFFFVVICVLFSAKNDIRAEMVVYDANGQFLGIADSFPSVYIPWIDRLVYLSVDDGKVINNSTIYYESTDCSGQPYIYSNFSYWIFQNEEIFYKGEKTVPANIETKSYKSSTGRCYQDVRSRLVVPVSVVPPPLAFPLALPLSIKIERPHPFKWKSSDIDKDRVPNETDNCPAIANPEQIDSDGDGSGDACDECPDDPDEIVPGICGCGVPDTDTDGDGLFYCEDKCPDDYQNDRDDDGVCGDIDNCPNNYNPDQQDTDGDGIGDVCDFSGPPYYGASLLKLKQNTFYRNAYTKVINWLSDFPAN